VKNLEPDVDWHVYYFDPATGRKFDQGTIKASAKAGDRTAKPVDFKKNVPSPQDWVIKRVRTPAFISSLVFPHIELLYSKWLTFRKS